MQSDPLFGGAPLASARRAPCHRGHRSGTPPWRPFHSASVSWTAPRSASTDLRPCPDAT